MKKIILYSVGVVVVGLLAYLVRVTLWSSNTNDANLTTYTNSEYHFSLKYPAKNVAATTTFATYYHAAGGWRYDAVSDEDRAAGTPLISLVVTRLGKETGPDQYYFNTEVRAGASRDSKQIVHCLESDQATTATSTANINGTNFNVYREESNGMSQYARVVSYRTVHNGACFAIESLITGGGTGVPPQDPSHSPELIAQAERATTALIKTFSFEN